ncbi:MAG TPA: NAD(P)(+) transhydrogenase (Re/Si-specific) subunit beta, partial [Gemmatimonadales bacterium]|nr:NAD(P)(+) transhydrogenase (Re/Si-specific) subunit beta [Gemmatimonadales bacterium]
MLPHGVAELLYLVAAVCFVIGLKRLGTPATAPSGNRISAFGMLIGVVVTRRPAVRTPLAILIAMGGLISWLILIGWPG